ncbi:hypothetical protein ABPG72_004607 [Tetrahymena utriculariae]
MNIQKILLNRCQSLSAQPAFYKINKCSFSEKKEDPYEKMCREQKEKIRQKDTENQKNRSLKDYVVISSLAVFMLTTTYFVGKKGLNILQEFQNPYKKNEKNKN